MDAIVTSWFLIGAGAIGVAILAVYYYRTKYAGYDFKYRVAGIWMNEALQIRVLIFDVNSTLHGSVIWTSEARSNLLGMRVLENLRMGSFRVCKGTYTDPITFKEYAVHARMKSRTSLKLYLSCKKSKQFLFHQDWKLVPIE